MSAFGLVLKALRTEKGLQQEDIRQALGLKSRQAVSHWETGRFNPDRKTIERLAEYFDVDVEYLQGKTPYRTRLERAQGNFFLTLGKHRVLSKGRESAVENWYAALDILLNEFVEQVRKDFDDAQYPYLFGAILSDMTHIMRRTNIFVEEYDRMRISVAGNEDLPVSAIKGCHDICSDLESTIVEWVMTSSFTRHERVIKLFEAKDKLEDEETKN